MYFLGDLRSAIFSPRARRSRSRCRIFSRSAPTDVISRDNVSGASSGIASVMTVAIAAIAENTIAAIRGLSSCSVRYSNMGPDSEIEVYHFFHDQDAERHPDRAAEHHHAPERFGPKQLDVLWTRNVDEAGHRRRQAADDHGGGLRLHRHGLDLRLHLLALAQHPRQIAQGFRQVSAGLLLDRDHDRKEVRLG